MAKSKIRFTALDFILIIILFLVVAFYFIRSAGMNSIKSENVHAKAVITLKVDNIKRENFRHFLEDEKIYKSEEGVRTELGIISDVRSSPSVKLVENEGDYSFAVDYSSVDLLLDVTVDSVYDRNSFYSVGGRYYMPALTFPADNGRIKFDCEVVSVKNAE